MSLAPEAEAILSAIDDLAVDIARLCPECAEKAAHMASLARELHGGSVDRGVVQDALGAESFDENLSDVKVRSTAEAVVRMSRETD